MKPVFFATPAALRKWFATHHRTEKELWVGYYRKDTGRPSITWPESVDEALCFGWIDGIRKRVDAESYASRFTPRRPRSIWSAVNTRRAEELIRAGRMRAAGLKAFRARTAGRSGVYSFEQRPEKLPAPLEKVFRRHRAAWDFYRAQPPGYRRASTWWVVSAKREATRKKRLEALIACSAAGRRLPPFERRKNIT